MEELISLNEFMRRYKVGYDVALQMMDEGKIEYQKTEGGRYKIKVGGDTVSRELYENAIKENAELKANIRNLKAILFEIKV